MWTHLNSLRKKNRCKEVYRAHTYILCRGALGLNDSTLAIVTTPREMASLTPHVPRAVASGSSHSVAVCAQVRRRHAQFETIHLVCTMIEIFGIFTSIPWQGCAYAWGDNMCGQLGHGGNLGRCLLFQCYCCT
jgi:hypothetical protein